MKNKKYDAIVVAVGYSQFKGYSKSNYEYFSNDGRIVIDIKNIVAEPTWR